MILVEGLWKSYGETTVVRDVSFVARDGAVTGFVGPNGAGKSTVLRVVAGLSAATRGEALVDGIRFADAPHPASMLGVFLGAEQLLPRLSGRSYLTYVCDLQRLPRTVADEALAMVGLADVDNRPVRAYSLGMKHRLGIAAATLARPKTLILDEPLNGLDPDGVHWMRSFVRTHADRGGCVLLSSHLMSELEIVADDIVMLNEGRIMASGGIAELTANAAREDVYVESAELPQLQRLLDEAGLRVENSGAGLVVGGLPAAEIVRTAYDAGLTVSRLEPRSASLEETYFHMMGGERA